MNRTRKVHRIAAGMSQEQVARAIGVCQSTFSGIERGTVEPDTETKAKIAKILGVEVAELFDISTEAA